MPPGNPSPAASKTLSPCQRPICTSHCIRPCSGRLVNVWRSRSGPKRCTGSPKRESPLTGSIKKARHQRRQTMVVLAGCARCLSGRRNSRIPASSCLRSRLICSPRKSTSSPRTVMSKNSRRRVHRLILPTVFILMLATAARVPRLTAGLCLCVPN